MKKCSWNPLGAWIWIVWFYEPRLTKQANMNNLLTTCRYLYLNIVWCGLPFQLLSLQLSCRTQTSVPSVQVLMFIPMLLMKIIWWRRAGDFFDFLLVKTASCSFNFSDLAYLASEMEQNFSFCLEQKWLGYIELNDNGNGGAIWKISVYSAMLDGIKIDSSASKGSLVQDKRYSFKLNRYCNWAALIDEQMRNVYNHFPC